jgi:SAM-dependent methyltransferase
MQVEIRSRPFLTLFRPVEVPNADWRDLNHCVVCQSSEFLRDVVTVRAESPAAVLSVCLDCEHGFVRRRPRTSWFERYYTSDWDTAGREDVSTRSRDVVPDAKVLDFVREFLPQSSAVLDIGAGFGDRLIPFRDSGHRIHAMELSDHRARFLRDQLHVSTYTDPVGKLRPTEPMHLVSLNHVLEHIDDPRQMLEDAKKLLRPGGLLYVAVPDFWRELPPLGAHFVPHLSWFSSRSLCRLFRRCGFKVLKCAVSKEIQVIGELAGPTADDAGEDSSDAAREQFWDRTSQHFLSAFGDKAASYSVVWSRSGDPEKHWDARLIEGSGVASALVRLGALARRHVPLRRLWLRLLPDYMRGYPLCILPIKVSGERRLPIEIRHADRGQTVWVK